MTQRTIAVNVGKSVILSRASIALGVPGTSASLMIEAAIRAYRGESRADIIDAISRYGSGHNGGRGGTIYAHIDDNLIAGIDNVSRAGRIGLAMITYDMSLDEATQWESGRVTPGRPRSVSDTVPAEIAAFLNNPVPR